MIKKNNLFPLFVLFALACVAVRGQETTVTTTVTPSQPAKGNFQIFTNDGGGSYLGVQLLEVNKENFGKFGLREVRGVAVEKVTENSPATQAGFQNGDVIVRFEDEQISSVRKLQRLIAEVAPDHQAKVTVLREGKERELTVTMGKRPAATFQTATSVSGFPAMKTMTVPGVPVFPRTPNVTVQPMPNAGTFFRTAPDSETMVWNFSFGRSIGIGTSSLTKQLGEYFGAVDGNGVLVTGVTENSPAAKGGIKAGDVIIEADGKAVVNSMELMKALNSKEKGSITITVLRDKNRQTLTVVPEERKPNTLKMDNKIKTNVVTTVTPQIAPLYMTNFPIDM